MDAFTRLIRGIDREQQRAAWLAYPVAVFKKFGDDQGGKLAALMAYYAFLAIFPLLLVFTTVLGWVLKGNQHLHDRLYHSALIEFPVIGDQLKDNGLQGHWYVLVISAVISLWGARGVADSAQYAFNTIWNVPYAQRPDWLMSLLRSIALVLSMALAVLVTGLLSGIGELTSSLGVATRIGAIALSLVINVGIFLLAFRVATASHVHIREMFWAAVASAVLWQGLLFVGTLLVSRQVAHAQVLYGTIGSVLGLLAWLHLQAQVTVFALEATAVRVRRLWPRSVSPPPLTSGDRRAFRAYAETTRRVPAGVAEVAVTFPPPAEPSLLDRLRGRVTRPDPPTTDPEAADRKPADRKPADRKPADRRVTDREADDRKADGGRLDEPADRSG